jgi:putative SOS response-associated peptidase YedK
MCGRYARFTPQHLYSQLFRAADMGMLSPRYNIAPSQAILVARNSEWGDYRELVTLYWGLVAPWAKDFKSARKMINARAGPMAGQQRQPQGGPALAAKPG